MLVAIYSYRRAIVSTGGNPGTGDYSFTIVLPQGDAPYSIDAFNASGTFEADYTVTGGATGSVVATDAFGSTGATGTVGLSNRRHGRHRRHRG